MQCIMNLRRASARRWPLRCTVKNVGRIQSPGPRNSGSPIPCHNSYLRDCITRRPPPRGSYFTECVKALNYEQQCRSAERSARYAVDTRPPISRCNHSLHHLQLFCLSSQMRLVVVVRFWRHQTGCTVSAATGCAASDLNPFPGRTGSRWMSVWNSTCTLQVTPAM